MLKTFSNMVSDVCNKYVGKIINAYLGMILLNGVNC
jgi:hypothetical protein